MRTTLLLVALLLLIPAAAMAEPALLVLSLGQCYVLAITGATPTAAGVYDVVGEFGNTCPSLFPGAAPARPAHGVALVSDSLVVLRIVRPGPLGDAHDLIVLHPDLAEWATVQGEARVQP